MIHEICMADPVTSNGLKTLPIAFKYVPFCVCLKYPVGKFSEQTKVALTKKGEVILDLSNMPILIAVSFLLGSSHRPLWNLIERSS